MLPDPDDGQGDVRRVEQTTLGKAPVADDVLQFERAPAAAGSRQQAGVGQSDR